MLTANHPSSALRCSYALGNLLILSGLAHIPVWLADGSPWQGPTSWRKPILFGLSTGVTLVSVTWVLSHLPKRKYDASLLIAFAMGLAIEVALITTQTWRGVASHFNRQTTTDAALLTAIELLITLAIVYIAYLTARTFGSLNAPRETQLAIRGGMTLLLLGCVIGFVITVLGHLQVASGQRPETFGKQGVFKFPHGIPLHAIQYLPISIWLGRRLGLTAYFRMQIVGALISLTLAFTLFGLLQTFSGRARFEFWWLSYTVLGIAFAITVGRFAFRILKQQPS